MSAVDLIPARLKGERLFRWMFKDELSFLEREYVLQAESERLIAVLAHPGCWACRNEKFPGHEHVRHEVQ